jgi:hypothetical protein
MREKKSSVPLTSRVRFKSEEVYIGFSDEELEELCRNKTSFFGRPGSGKLLSAVEAYPASEMYSLGRGLRATAGFPRWFPIPASMDHGIDFRTHLEGYQEAEFARYFLTWSKWRTRSEERTKKKIQLIMFPMVALRRKLQMQKLPTARGTLVFMDHSLPGWSQPGDFSKSLERFLNLPKEFHPLVLCLHMHDINKGAHRQLRTHNIPIVTAGDIHSYWFADRFYSILQNFQFSTSSMVGTHTFLSQELGVHFFLGEDTEIREGQRNRKLELHPPVNDWRYRYEQMARVFSEIPPGPSIEKDILVDYALGTGVPFAENAAQLRWFLLREIFLNSPRMALQLFTRFVRALSRK